MSVNKTCKTCGEVKVSEEFYSKGLECKVCTRRRTMNNKIQKRIEQSESTQSNKPKPLKGEELRIVTNSDFNELATTVDNIKDRFNKIILDKDHIDEVKFADMFHKYCGVQLSLIQAEFSKQIDVIVESYIQICNKKSEEFNYEISKMRNTVDLIEEDFEKSIERTKQLEQQCNALKKQNEELIQRLNELENITEL